MASKRVRNPAVAGTFYRGDGETLATEVTSMLANPARPKRRALGVMVPHAGHVFSGAICGRALASVEIPGTVLLLHTKHRPGGGVLSLASFDAWATPLGEVPADTDLMAALAQVPDVAVSDLPHFEEHAAEVVLPFLQMLRPDVRIAVLSVGPAPYRLLERAGSAIAAVLAGRDVLVIASSDMNHYEDHETTLRKDALALQELAGFAPDAMLATCDEHRISMCGAHATALMLTIARSLGGHAVELMEHDTSAPVSGDYTQTVGYASARVL